MQKTAFAVMYLLTASLPVAAQKIDAALKLVATKFPEEKAYIQYDKEQYVAGETIWFKGYLYSSGLPSGLSNNFYLQLIDERGKVYARKHFPVQGSTIRGNIDLPDSIPQGYYHIRALTPAMLNSIEGAIYSKSIFIFNPTAKTKSQAPNAVEKSIHVQFFPESGNLIDDVLTTVAFKATDENGFPVAITGDLKMENGTNILPFASTHDGMGRMQFKPQAGNKYVAIVKAKDQSAIYPLPDVQETGVNLRVEDEPGGKYYVLSRSKKEQRSFDRLSIIGTLNNSIVFEKTIHFDQFLSVKGHLLTENLPPGILHLTVFNDDGMPLVERLTFINNLPKNTDSIAVIKKGTKARQVNTIEVIFPDSIQHSCSVAVTDLETRELAGTENIRSKLLLTDDLKGQVYNPAWYFRQPWDSVQKLVDNLMLTHGWSRYNWIKILADEFPQKKYADTYLMNITGKVTSEKDKKPMSGGTLNIVLASEDSSLYAYTVPVQENGNFLVDSLVTVGKTKVYYTYSDPKQKEKKVVITTDEDILAQNFMEILSTVPPTTGLVYPVDLKATGIKRRHDFVRAGNPEAKWLENVTLKTQRPPKPVEVVNEKYTSELFRTGGRVIIDNINNKVSDRALNGLDYVNNRIHTVDTQGNQFVNKKNFSLMNMKDRESVGPMRYWEVGLFIDEFPANLLQLKLLRADQIAYVKFFEAGSITAGSLYPGGAIAVYLKKELDEPSSLAKGNYIVHNGYSLTKEFYSPDYSVQPPPPNKTDNRTTLYWSPDLYTDGLSRSVKINFYNNDFSRRFRVVVEGFDANGKLIHLERTIEDDDPAPNPVPGQRITGKTDLITVDN
jgi:hypothetical protein